MSEPKVLRSVVAALLFASLGIAGCAGCEDTVCCAIDGHALPRVLRPSQCSAMRGVGIAPSACDVVCCRATDGSHAAGSRATCAHVVDPSFCDVDAAAP